MKPQSFLASLFHSAIWAATGRGAGLIKHVVIAAAIGLSTQLDIFYMAMAILGLLVNIWAEILEVLALPQLVVLERDGKRREFARLAGGVFLLAVIAGLVICAGVVGLRDVIAGLAFGFDAARQAELAEAFFWFIPHILLAIPLGALYLVLKARRLFSWFYQGDALVSVVILACILLAPEHPAVLLWSVSAGSIVATLFVGAVAARHVAFPVNPFDGAILRLFRIAPGLLVLNSTYLFFLMLDRVFASFLDTGAISALAYGMTIALIFSFLLNLGGGFMTVAAEKPSRAARAATLDDLFSLVILLSAGATAFMVLAGRDVIAVLLERGAFGATDTDAVASALSAFAFIIAPMFALRPIDQLFQIEKRIGMMVWRVLCGIVAGVALNYIAVFVLGWGIFGLALATTISFWLITLLGIIGLMRIGYPIAIVRHLRWAGWCAGFIGVGAFVFILLPDAGSFTDIIIAGGFIGATMAAAGLLYPKSREAELVAGIRKRILAPLRKLK